MSKRIKELIEKVTEDKFSDAETLFQEEIEERLTVKIDEMQEGCDEESKKKIKEVDGDKDKGIKMMKMMTIKKKINEIN